MATVALSIAESIGGPSAVAVVNQEQLPADETEMLAAMQTVVVELGSLGFGVSKCAVVSHLSDRDAMTFRSVQVRGMDYGQPVLETGKDCGNSMIASTLIGLLGKYGTAAQSDRSVQISNSDTGFTATMEVVDGDVRTATLNLAIPSVVGQVPANTLLTGSPQWPVSFIDGKIAVTALDIVNPYIVVAAQALGIDIAEPLLEGYPDSQLLQSLKEIRLAVRSALAYPANSEFPKIAVAHRAGSRIVARTVYRADWHPGLPITASISLAAAAQLSEGVIGASQPSTNPFTIETPLESIPLRLQIDSVTGAITVCSIRNRRAVLRQSDVRINV